MCQVSMERYVQRIFMSVRRTFFSAKSFHQINQSPSTFATETFYKYHNTSRWYALDGSFSRGTTNCSGYVDISTSALEVFNQHSKINIGSDIDFGVSNSIRRVTEYDNKSATRKSRKDKNQCKEFLKKSLVTARELSKLIGRLSSTALAFLPAPLQYRTLQHEQIQGMISKSSLEGQLSLSKQVTGELHWWIQNISLYNGEVCNFSLSATDKKFRCINPRFEASCQGQTTGGPWSRKERKPRVNVCWN